MQSILILLALLGLTSAIPTPQLIDTEGVAAGPDPVFVVPSYNLREEAGATDEPAIAARNRLYRRDGTCAVQPAGSGPVSSPDTTDAFASNPTWSTLAGGAPTPDGYSIIMQNAAASLSASNYMGLRTLTDYDSLGCASLCNQADGCEAFNIYSERDPSLDPNTVTCPNPPSITNYKCTLWGATVSAAQATNQGQWRASFQVLIAGSNAYNKVSPPSAIACYTGPAALGGAINAPVNAQGQNTYMGYKFHAFSQLQGYDTSTCAADCNAQTAYNKRHPAADGSYQTCVFFNAYVLSMNAVPQGLYCSMYTQVWAASYATNYGQYRGTDRYTVSRSYSYSLNLAGDDNGSCASGTATPSSSSLSSTSTSQATAQSTSASVVTDLTSTTSSSTTAQSSTSPVTSAVTSSTPSSSSDTTSSSSSSSSSSSTSTSQVTSDVTSSTSSSSSSSSTTPDTTSTVSTSTSTSTSTSMTSSTFSTAPTASTSISTSTSTSMTSSSSASSTPSTTPLTNFCLQNPTTKQFASLDKGGNGLAYIDGKNNKNLPSLFTLDASSRLVSTKTSLLAVLNLSTFGKDGSASGHIEGTDLDKLAGNKNYNALVCDVGSGYLVCRSAANYIDPVKTPASRSQLYTITGGNNNGVEQFIFAPTTVQGATVIKVLPASACGPNYS
ncbi:MAG: hypothetical protein Q9168_000069 [Polycauliona sp. 1 TL-2023]